MSVGPTLLLIEDSPSDAQIIESYVIEGLLGAVTVEREHTVGGGLARLSKGGVDAILLDLGLPDSAGLSSLQAVASTVPRVPIVIVSGLNDTRLAEEALKLGAQDYVVKGVAAPEDLARAVTYAIARQRVLDDLERTRYAQLQAKDLFLSHVSHELRTPLAAVHQFVSLVADETVGRIDSEQRECLDVAMRNIRHLTRMIDDLLVMGRLAAAAITFRPELTGLSNLVKQCVFTLRSRAEAKSIGIYVEPASLPDAWCDPGRTTEVLTNLLDNSLKFMASGGSISVRVASTDNDVWVTVQDSGCGVRPENRGRVFEQFFQEEGDVDSGRAGLGLGLFVCRELVEGQGGRIWMENTPLVRGSSFTFTLPAHGPGTTGDAK